EAKTVGELLKCMGIKVREVGFAVAVNEEVIPKSEYDSRKLRDGDKVEIVQLVGGG
ncbi:MAG TPA: sulfur carrier protein ThiS, partial [Aquificaceae bacterium]|nr:sulfur carrier protein ThiS [Aquificaceae bacterium]